MSDINISIPAGEKKRLLTGGKYCPDDIVVEAEGGDTDAAFEAGRKAEYDAFWDSAVPDPNGQGGTATFAGKCWNDKTFKPPSKIILCGNCNYCFYNSGMTDLRPYVVFERVTTLNATFQYSSAKNIPAIDASAASMLSSTFVSDVEVIDGLTVAASTRFSSAFNNAKSLKHVIFDGTIGQNGLYLGESTLLDRESIESIINTLSTTTSGLTITLSATAVNNAFETSSGAADGSTSAEWEALIATKTNWTITLV